MQRKEYRITYNTSAYFGLFFLLQHIPSAAKPIFKPCGSLATQKGEQRRACKCLLCQALYFNIRSIIESIVYMSLPFVHDVFSLPAPFQPILKGSFSSSWRPLSQDCNFLKSTVLSAARGTGLRASQMQGIVSACLLPTRCDQREAQFREVLVFPQAIGCTITLRQ